MVQVTAHSAMISEELKHRERRSFPTPVTEYEYVWMNHELFYAVLALDGLVLIFCFCCLAGIFVFKKHLTFTNAGISVIYLFIFGCILNLFSLPLFGVDTKLIPSLNIPHACMARIWMLSVGFSLSVGMLITRVIYTVVTEMNKNIKTYVIPVSTLIISVLGLVIVDTIIIIAWSGLSPPHKSYEEKKVELVGLRDERVTLVETCNSEKESLLIAIFCFYKGALLLLASVLSLLKRKDNETSNDEDLAQCRIALLSSLLTAFVTVPVVLGLPMNPNESFVIGGVLLLLEITFLMCWIICSKIFKAYRCKKGEAVEFGKYSIHRELTISTPCVRATYGCIYNGKLPGFSNNAFVDSMIDLEPNPDEMVKSTDDNADIGVGFDCKESEDVLPEDLPSHNEIDMQPYKEKEGENEEGDNDENHSYSDSENDMSESDMSNSESTIEKSAVSIHVAKSNGEETFKPDTDDGEEMFDKDDDFTNSVSEQESTIGNVETDETSTNGKRWRKPLILMGFLKGSKQSPAVQEGDRSGRDTSNPREMAEARRFSKSSGNDKTGNSSDSYGESSDDD